MPGKKLPLRTTEIVRITPTDEQLQLHGAQMQVQGPMGDYRGSMSHSQRAHNGDTGGWANGMDQWGNVIRARMFRPDP